MKYSKEYIQNRIHQGIKTWLQLKPSHRGLKCPFSNSPIQTKYYCLFCIKLFPRIDGSINFDETRICPCKVHSIKYISAKVSNYLKQYNLTSS